MDDPFTLILQLIGLGFLVWGVITFFRASPGSQKFTVVFIGALIFLIILFIVGIVLVPIIAFFIGLILTIQEFLRLLIGLPEKIRKRI